MRHNILYSTLVFLFLSSPYFHFNYRYDAPLMSVNEINVEVADVPSITKPLRLNKSQSTASTNGDKDKQLDHFAKRDYQLKTVVIDPGHGGHDKGCSGVHSKEKHISLKIAKKLGQFINDEFPKVKVIYTRSTDIFVPLHSRAAIANKNQADLFISIHCNAVSSQKHLAKGTETYVMGLHDAEENLAVAKRENEAILLEKDYEANYDGFDPESPAGHIILAMVQNAFLEQSISFAQKVENNFKYIAGRKSRGVKQAGFVVLRATAMPRVLVEAGYLTNKIEEKFMNSSRGQEDLAFAIFKAFKDYKREVEVDNATTPPPLPTKMTRSIDPNKNSANKKTKVSSNEKSQRPMPSVDMNSGEGFKSSEKRIRKNKKVYHVQLLAADRKVSTNSRKWRAVDFPVEIKREKGKFKYLAGNFENLAAAKAAQKEIRKGGFRDAFVVAYRKGKRVKAE